MQTILVIIALIIAFIILKFLFDMMKQNRAISHEGGMSTKYRLLVSELMEIDERYERIFLGIEPVRIIHQSANTIQIGASESNNSVAVMIMSSFGSTIVRWTVKSDEVGNHGLEWKFGGGTSQVEMMNDIYQRICKAQDRLRFGPV